MKDFYLCHQMVEGSPHMAMVLVCVPSGASVVGDMCPGYLLMKLVVLSDIPLSSYTVVHLAIYSL